MPNRVNVPKLEKICLLTIAKLIKKICLDKNITYYNLYEIVPYFQTLPKCIQSQISKTIIENYKRTPEIKSEKINEKHLFFFVYLNCNEILLNDFHQPLLFLVDFEPIGVDTLTLSGSSFPFPRDNANQDDMEIENRTTVYRPLYSFMSKLSNLVTFKSVRMCDDKMFEIFAKCCPHLENIEVELSYTLSDEGVSFLCGFNSAKEAKTSLKIANLAKRNLGCRKLKNIDLDFTMASNLSVASLLQWCPLLENINISPDINIGEVFTMIYGFDTLSFNIVTAKYNLTSLRSSCFPIDENILSLVVQTCPNLKDVALRCTGAQRSDKNLIANLLKVSITTLDLMNCHTEPFLWYLNLRGSLIEKLVIEHLMTAPAGVVLNRTHLQTIISTCPKVTQFSLKMCGNISISADLPYSSFGNRLQYFTTLKGLYVEGVNLHPEDVRILLGKCHEIEDVSLMCQSLEILEDHFLDELITMGSFKNLKKFYAFRPFLTYSGLQKLLTECPLLESVGPLSSWAIPKKDREKLISDIKRNNWNLNVESSEMLQTFFI